MTHQTTAVTKEDVTQVKHHRKEKESNMKPQQKVDKTFEELVEESIRLPELNASSCLPMTMTEILRSSKKEKDVTTKLPKIHSGQVQLVTMGDGFSSERKRRRGKKVKAHRRPETPSPRAVPEINSKSVRVACSKQAANSATEETNTVKTHWKKKLHKRQSKRHLTDEGDPLNVSITISGYQHYKEYRT